MKYMQDIEEFICVINKKDFDKHIEITSAEKYEHIRKRLLLNMGDYTSYRIENLLIGLDEFVKFFNNTDTEFRGFW